MLPETGSDVRAGPRQEGRLVEFELVSAGSPHPPRSILPTTRSSRLSSVIRAELSQQVRDVLPFGFGAAVVAVAVGLGAFRETPAIASSLILLCPLFVSVAALGNHIGEEFASGFTRLYFTMPLRRTSYLATKAAVALVLIIGSSVPSIWILEASGIASTEDSVLVLVPVSVWTLAVGLVLSTTLQRSAGATGGVLAILALTASSAYLFLVDPASHPIAIRLYHALPGTLALEHFAGISGPFSIRPVQVLGLEALLLALVAMTYNLVRPNLLEVTPLARIIAFASAAAALLMPALVLPLTTVAP